MSYAALLAHDILEVEIVADRCARLADAVVGPQIYLLVFDAAPQPLDEHVVPPCVFAVHADRRWRCRRARQ
jgi:hypothetical protein